MQNISSIIGVRVKVLELFYSNGSQSWSLIVESLNSTIIAINVFHGCTSCRIVALIHLLLTLFNGPILNDCDKPSSILGPM